MRLPKIEQRNLAKILHAIVSVAYFSVVGLVLRQYTTVLMPEFLQSDSGQFWLVAAFYTIVLCVAAILPVFSCWMVWSAANDTPREIFHSILMFTVVLALSYPVLEHFALFVFENGFNFQNFGASFIDASSNAYFMIVVTLYGFSTGVTLLLTIPFGAFYIVVRGWSKIITMLPQSEPAE